MDYYIERLNHELRHIIEFWQNYAIKNNRIAPKVSITGNISFDAPLGTIYLSRLLYGSSAACMHLKDISSRNIADLAYQTLRNQLSNPSGGYYWAVDKNGRIIHDDLHCSMAQAFIVNGLSQYYALTGDEDIKKEIYNQIDFIENTIKHFTDNSYLDGFEEDWTPQKKQYKTLGTHLHMLEAYGNFVEVSDNLIYRRNIEKILELLIFRFINKANGEMIHRFSNSWKALPNENWIGHNVEAGWIIYYTAKLTDNTDLLREGEAILLSVCDHAIDFGFDRQYGGMFNRFIGDETITTNKEWWAQSESVIAFLNAYEVSNDKKYLSYAIRLLEYIDNTFSDQEKGEWYDSVTREGKPINDLPKLHLWKSMYHNVRYCIESVKHLQQLFVKA
jgi:mannobiose 2-epimerase